MAEASVKRGVGSAAIALGVLVALLAVLADPLGVGTREGIGLHQSALLAMGILIAVGGGLLAHGSVSAKRVGYGAIALGVLAALVAVLADPLGFGRREGIGLPQSVLLAMGVLIAVGGVGLTRIE